MNVGDRLFCRTNMIARVCKENRRLSFVTQVSKEMISDLRRNTFLLGCSMPLLSDEPCVTPKMTFVIEKFVS